MPVFRKFPNGAAFDPDNPLLELFPDLEPETILVMAEASPVTPPTGEQAYPPPVASCPCSESTICTLAGLYAGPVSELTGVLQNVYYGLIFEDECPAASELFFSHALDEMHHLRLLGELLMSCGVCPCYTAVPGWWSAVPTVISYDTCLENAVCHAMEGERSDAARYRRLAESLCDEGIAALFLRLAADEENHLAALEELQAAVCQTM
jgi:bacterioferritin (cytochrome b1)